MEHLWKDEYKIGSKQIDEQHYQLFCRIERLIYIIKSGDFERMKQECEATLDFLVKYTIVHFASEEKIMRELDYVDYNAHKNMHIQFKNTVMSYKERLGADFSKELLNGLLGTLLAWLTIHVYIYDRKIPKNEPLRQGINYTDECDFLKKAVVRFLSEMNGIAVISAAPLIYKMDMSSDVYIRAVVNSEGKRHTLVYGLDKRLAFYLYHSVSGMEPAGPYTDVFEQSVMKEIGNMISSYIAGHISSEDLSGILFEVDVFCDKGLLGDRSLLSRNVTLEITTECGKMSVMHMAE